MRKKRELRYGATYHVYARANRQEFILEKIFVKKMFMKVLERAKQKFKFRIINFCIMGNHVHIMIKPLNNENLSSIMQWILSVFAQKYNRTYALQGHVWYDRFKSKIINDFRQALHTFIYISHNPVKAGIVKNAVDYPYCGVGYHPKFGNGILEIPPS